MITEEEIAEWCDDNLADLYNVGMFDDEDIAEDVWEAVHQMAEETLLDFVEDSEELEEALHEAAEDWFRTHHNALIESLPVVSAEEIAALQNKPQVAQHSADWYAQRRNRLTASEFHQVLSGSRDYLMRQKLAPNTEDRPTQAPVAIAQEDGEMNATVWGHRFEPVTRRIYELEIAGVDTVCDTMGRFNHPDIPWLSASPDGLVVKGALAGRLVEIKSPKTRQPGKYVPGEYYVQMQIQMEVCQLDAVDFVEAQFAQRPDGNLSAQDEIDLDVATWKGRIHVYGDLEDSTTWCYRYSEPVEDLEDAEIVDPPADLPLLESSVWWLMGWYPRTVLRNADWWETVGWPSAQDFWVELEAKREAAMNAEMGQVLTLTDDDKIVLIPSTGTGWIGRSSVAPQILPPE